MLCDKCLNRTICKYYDFLKDAPMIINIESCEKATFNNSKIINTNPNNNVALLNYKEPIDYSKFNLEEEQEDFEDEERIFVDLSETTEEKGKSMLDLLMEGDDNNGDAKKE